MKATYEIENGKKVRAETYDDGRVDKFDENGNRYRWLDRPDLKEGWRVQFKKEDKWWTFAEAYDTMKVWLD